MDKYINAPISDEDARSLKSGDYVYITGTIYTARDAAHKRMAEALERKEQLPIDMKNPVDKVSINNFDSCSPFWF